MWLNSPIYHYDPNFWGWGGSIQIGVFIVKLFLNSYCVLKEMN